SMLAALGLGCAPRSRAPAVPPHVARAVGAVAVMPFRVGGELDPAASFAARRDVPAVPEDVGDHIAVTLGRQLALDGVTVSDSAAVQQAPPPPGTSRYDPAMAMRLANAVGAGLVGMGRSPDTSSARDPPRGTDAPDRLDLPRFLQGGGKRVTREKIWTVRSTRRPRNSRGRFARRRDPLICDGDGCAAGPEEIGRTGWRGPAAQTRRSKGSGS